MMKLKWAVFKYEDVTDTDFQLVRVSRIFENRDDAEQFIDRMPLVATEEKRSAYRVMSL